MTKNTQFSPAGTHGPSPARTLEPPPAPSDGESRPHAHGGLPCAGARDEEVLRGGGTHPAVLTRPPHPVTPPTAGGRAGLCAGDSRDEVPSHGAGARAGAGQQCGH